MSWLKERIGTEKAIIAMCHIRALPGDPSYDAKEGMNWVLDRAYEDLQALQNGGVDAVMFSNEFSLPYLTDVRKETLAAMGYIIGSLKKEITVPFGVNVLWDPAASLDLAVATGAVFVREIFTGVYASDFGLWNTNCGSVVRHQHAVSAQNVKLLMNIVPEAARYLGERDVAEVAKTTAFNCKPDALCVSGLTAGSSTDSQVLQRVKDTVGDLVVFANTGCRVDNIATQLSIADGAIVGTTFKKDGLFDNFVEEGRVRQFMNRVHECRGG